MDGRRAKKRRSIIFFVCVAHFLFWYGVHVFDDGEMATALRPYETWNNINHTNPERRIAISRQLAKRPANC